MWFPKELVPGWAPPQWDMHACVGSMLAGSKGLCAPGHLGFCESAGDYT